METCTTCNLQFKRNNKYHHLLTNGHLAVSNQYYCQQCKTIMSLADKGLHLQSNEHKNSKRMWYCEDCNKDMNSKTKSSHITTTSHIRNSYRVSRSRFAVFLHKLRIGQYEFHDNTITMK